VNYSKAPISDQFVVDVSKRSEISDNSNLDMTKHMDESSHQFFEIADPYNKSVRIKNLNQLFNSNILENCASNE